ncbi:helix-turn-helix transcriptional regulator [Georgenia daeguensis]|uniref:helix-turn-helix domain-containing protein n=1 Tax=Georgenia daeguensis TaxID=908355 RepID=UPI0031EB8352
MRRNLPALREAAGLTQRVLATELAELGYPLPASTVAKVENGTRRASLDDVVALAAALDVSPLRLMLPPERDDSESPKGERGPRLAVTPSESVSGHDAWSWAEQSIPWWLAEQPDPSGRRYAAWQSRRLMYREDDVDPFPHAVDADGGALRQLRAEVETLRRGDYGRVLAELREIRRDVGRALAPNRGDRHGKR